jgi:WD40 repeat protein
MNMRHLERWRGELYGRRRLGGANRVAAAGALARDASPAAVRILIDAILGESDQQAREQALFALRHMADWRCVNAVCAAWAATRNADLAAVIVERGWVATAPASLRVLSALRADRGELLARSRASAVLPLVRACEDRDQTIAGRARAALIRLERPDARVALCRLAVERDMPVAREAALVASFSPPDPRERALFFFVTGQWRAYHQHDPDGALLGAAYAAASPPVRERVAAQARRARFTAWARAAVATRRTLSPAAMDAQEWAAAVEALLAGDAPEDAWALAQSAPPIYAASLVRGLAAAGWSPGTPAQQARFATLAGLAASCDEVSPDIAYLSGCGAGHRRAVTRLAFGRDGGLLASGAADGTVALWRPPELELLGGERTHPWTIASLSFSPDGTLLLSASTVGALRLLRVVERAGRPALEPAVALDGRHPALLLSGGAVAAGGPLRLWQLPGAERVAELPAHSARVSALAASPDGRLLASAGVAEGPATDDRRGRGGESCVRLWRLPEGAIAGVLGAGAGVVQQLLFSPDGRVLAAAGSRVRLWNPADGMLLAELPARAPIAFTPDGTLVGIGDDGLVRAWPAGGADPARVLEARGGVERATSCLAVSEDGRLLATSAGDGVVRLQLLPTGRLLGELRGPGAPLVSLAFDGCGRMLAAGYGDGSIRLWRLGAAALCHVPMSLLKAADVERATAELRDPETPAADRAWLELVVAMKAHPPRPGRAPSQRRVSAGEVDLILA